MKKRTVIFPLNVEGRHFETHADLYKYYYDAEVNDLVEFSKPFWAIGINLVALVHFPEQFNLITEEVLGDNVITQLVNALKPLADLDKQGSKLITEKEISRARKLVDAITPLVNKNIDLGKSFENFKKIQNENN